MGYLAIGKVSPVPRAEWDSEYDYKRLDIVTFENKAYIAKRPSRGMMPIEVSNPYWLLMMEPYLTEMIGATETTDGAHGLVPTPLAGDQDKALSGSGEWKHKLQTDILYNGDRYGYLNENNEFVPFLTYEEAINEGLIGSAEPEDVRMGTTFTNHSSRALSGAMSDYSATKLIADTNESNEYTPLLQLIDGGEYYEVTMPTGYWKYDKDKSGVLVQTEEKTVTAGTSNVTVTPSTGKVLTKVIVKGTPIQAKTVTASRSQQVVKPDSGYHLSQVTVNKYPDATGTYKPTANSSASDMGATNNYRYVDTTAVYKLGAVNRVSNAVKIGSAESVASKTFTVTSYSNYKNFSVKNFFYIVTKVTTDIGSGYAQTPPVWDKTGWYGMANVGTGKITMLPKLSYDASTGVLTVSGLKASKSISVSAKIDCSSHDHQEYGGGSFSVTETLFIDVYLIPT